MYEIYTFSLFSASLLVDKVKLSVKGEPKKPAEKILLLSSRSLPFL
jgi:hypothetical protein